MAYNGIFEAAPVVPAECGLFSVATVVRHDDNDLEWTFGYHQLHASSQAVAIVPTNGDAGPAVAIHGFVDHSDNNVVGATFEVVIEEMFTGLGANKDTPFERLRDVMEPASERAVEYALWTGKGIEGIEGAHWLFDADARTKSAGTDKDYYLATAEEAISENLLGIQGVIHMSRRTATVINSFEREGKSLSTILGTPVVAGTGYGHTDPTANFMAVTGPVTVHLGPIVINDENLRNNFDASTNTYHVRASRLVSVTFDPSLHVKITNS